MEEEAHAYRMDVLRQAKYLQCVRPRSPPPYHVPTPASAAMYDVMSKPDPHALRRRGTRQSKGLKSPFPDRRALTVRPVIICTGC